MTDKKHLMIAINWFGPYRSIEEAREAAKSDFDQGLYLCLGKRAYQRKAELQYVGIAKKLGGRISDRHHRLPDVTRECQIWLGEIVTAEPGGRKMKVTPATLDYAEWLHARFLRLPLNDKKTKSLPPRSVTVLNRWWKKDYETPFRRRPHTDWPDLIDYPAYGSPGRLVWFGSRQSHIMPPEYAKPE